MMLVMKKMIKKYKMMLIKINKNKLNKKNKIKIYNKLKIIKKINHSNNRN